MLPNPLFLFPTSNMFCADYAAAFFVHAFLVGVGAIGSPGGTLSEGGIVAGAVGRPQCEKPTAAPFALGAFAGLGGAVALFPFDFVRRGLSPTANARTLFIGSLSVVPYSTAFFGVYFALRDPTSIQSQASCAMLASSCAVAAELPFDGAKRALFAGDRRLLLGVNLLYAPFAAMMIIMYDKAIQNNVAPVNRRTVTK
jgi:hypothetical protein